MKINKLRAILIAICCSFASSWSETQCSEETPDNNLEAPQDTSTYSQHEADYQADMREVKFDYEQRYDSYSREDAIQDLHEDKINGS